MALTKSNVTFCSVVTSWTVPSMRRRTREGLKTMIQRKAHSYEVNQVGEKARKMSELVSHVVVILCSQIYILRTSPVMPSNLVASAGTSLLQWVASFLCHERKSRFRALIMTVDCLAICLTMSCNEKLGVPSWRSWKNQSSCSECL